MARTDDPNIRIGRDDAQVEPGPPPERSPRPKHGHPLPADDRARHGSIPEHLIEERDAGDD
jgi:hypothetical protein